MNRPVPSRPRRSERSARGFSLVELLIAMAVLIIGLVGIAELVPASILINQRGRLDSSSLVFAQRELDQMVVHKLTDTSFFEANGALCAAFCSLGDASTPGTPQGNGLIWVNNRPLINFGAAPVDNFSFAWTDPNDPFGLVYDVRWAVITTVSGSSITAKRFIVGVRQRNAPNFIPAVTVDAAVEQ